MYRIFEGLVDPFSSRFDGPPTLHVWSFLAKQLSPYRFILPWMALAGLLKALIECGLIFYSGRLIDMMTETGTADFWAEHKLEVLIVVIGVLVIRPLVIWVHHLLLDQSVSSNLQEQVRWQAHNLLLQHPVGFFRKQMAGRLSARVMQLGQSVEEIVHSFFEAIWFALVYVAVAIALLAEIDGRLAVPLFAWLVVYLFYVKKMAAKIARASHKWSDARSAVTGTVVDAYANIETVKTYSSEAYEQTNCLGGMQKLRFGAQGFRRVMTELSLGMNLLNGAMIVAVVGPGVFLWMQDLATIGQVAAASALAIRLNGMTGWIMFVATRVFENIGVLRDSLATLSAPIEHADRPNALRDTISGGSVEFRNVSHWHREGHPTLTDISFQLPERKHLAVVGPSGAGKSSLVRLLLRLEAPNAGQILVDGSDIADCEQSYIRSRISIVPQDPSFLHRSVYDNLTYGLGTVCDAAVLEALELSEAREFVSNIIDNQGRHGLEAYIGERGAQLSGGQRQRLAIARAILRTSPILILDEATSALDSVLESKVLRNMESFLSQRTVIAIAHRLSTISNFERIVVLSDGGIVEDGTHASLLRSGGLYASMWKRQTATSPVLEDAL